MKNLGREQDRVFYHERARCGLLLMNQPVDPLASNTHPTEPQPPTPGTNYDEAATLSSQESLLERIFKDAHGVRSGWRLFLFFALTFVIARMLGWLGQSLFPDTGAGSRHLWEDFYGETISLAGALISTMILSRIDGRRFGAYGLPQSHAFGRLFWIGAVWGLAWITALLLLMHSAHVFDFGSIALHGKRLLRFAVFWATNFLIVALFEEAVFRGYFQFALSERVGFWPTAVLGSAFFGGVHLFNKLETPIGALGAGLIGLFLCLTLHRTGSLWFAVGFHAAWDWGETFLYGVPDSGTTAPGHLLSPTVHGNYWLTGGPVGPEASVLLLIIVAAMWVAFDRRYRVARYGPQPPPDHHV
jgi:uncharacterized protein